MSSLYKIEQELLNIFEQVAEQDGVLDADTEQLLAIKREELEFKVVGYDQAIKYLEGEAMMAQLEIERLQKFATRQTKIVENLKKSLLQATLLFGEEDKKGIKRLKFGTIELSTRRSKSIEITDKNDIDDKFKKVDFTLEDLSIKELGIVKAALKERSETLPVIETKENVKISKTDLKSAIEKYKQELEALNLLLSSGKLSQEEYNDKLFDLEKDKVEGAEQIEKVSLVIK